MVEHARKIGPIQKPRVELGLGLRDGGPHKTMMDVLASLTPEVKISPFGINSGEYRAFTTAEGRELVKHLIHIPEMLVMGSLNDGIFPNEVEPFKNRVDQCRWDEETKARVAAQRYLNEVGRLEDMQERLNGDGIFSEDKDMDKKIGWLRSRAKEILGDLEPITPNEIEALIRQTVGNEVFNIATLSTIHDSSSK